ncbi:O-antigen ligase family protein [Psychrobacter sp. 1Y11]|uniref:O-antigen ligase family protein n=1 Tax=Psychrobacter sp. 1Y11 TaxID=3457446 RepID=UPI003FD57DBB
MQSDTLSINQGQPELIVKLLITLLLILPFLLPWYYPPYINFYMDITVGMLSALFAVYLLFNTNNLKSSIVTICLLAFALYLPLQNLILQSPYLGSSFYTSGFFILLALLLTAILSVPKSYFKLITFSVLWGIVILAIIQLVLYVIQLWIIDPVLKDKLGWILFSGNGGQVGQRNNFSHIIMWGFIASITLERMGKLSSIKMWLLILCYSLVMAHAGSRTVVLYIVGLSAMAGYQLLITQEKNTKTFSRNILIALAVALFTQFIFPFISSDVSSGTDRLLGDSEYLSRWLEWQKAWLAFLDAPLLGQGWGTYGFQSFWYHDQVATMGVSRANNYFSHCHNLLLQLLAEVGLLGTLLVTLPLLYILLKAFFKYTSDVMTFGLVMICTISLLHSMVELPLWHSNFLIVFCLVLSLIVRQVSLDNQELTESDKKKGNLKRLGIFYATLVMLLLVIILVDHERQVNKTFALGGDIHHAQSIAIGEQGRYIPFYYKYADKLDTSKVNPDTESKEEMLLSDQLITNNMQVFPYYTHTAAHIIYLQRMGKADEARLWLDKTALYYPRVLPGLIRLTQKYPDELGYLQQHTIGLCDKAVASAMYGLQSEHCLIPVINN